MPRKAKSKADAVDYSNRTDLAQGTPPQPVTAAPNQAYGERGAQEQAQQEMPLPDAQAGMMQQAMGAAQAHDFQPVNLGAPTARPGEPITAGLSSGPGPGPEAFKPRYSQASEILQRLSELTGDNTSGQLAELLRIRGG